MADRVVADEASGRTASAGLRRWLRRGLFGASGGLLLILLVLGLNARALDAAPPGEPAPPFALPLLGGGEVRSQDLLGRVVVINVWASWCPPCRAEAPALRNAYADADPEEVAFLGVSRDDDEDDAEGFVDQFDVPFPNALGDGGFARDFGVRGLPTTIVLDASGAYVATHFGPISESKLAVLIADAITRSRLRDGAAGE